MSKDGTAPLDDDIAPLKRRSARVWVAAGVWPFWWPLIVVWEAAARGQERTTRPEAFAAGSGLPENVVDLAAWRARRFRRTDTAEMAGRDGTV
jgi:hypothetical protein